MFTVTAHVSGTKQNKAQNPGHKLGNWITFSITFKPRSSGLLCALNKTELKRQRDVVDKLHVGILKCNDDNNILFYNYDKQCQKVTHIPWVTVSTSPQCQQ